MTFSSVFLFYRGPQRECKNEFSNLVPVGLFNILYYLKKNGINAKLYNLSHFSEKKLYGFLNNLKPEISFISSFYGNHWEAIKLSELIKKNYPNSVTIIGGPISVIGEDILRKFRNIDYIIYGEGETASLKLVKFLHEKITNIKEIENLIYWENDKIKKNPPSFYNNIDEFFYIPSQIKNNVNFVQDENFQVLITSRGCPFSCSFCSSPVLWGRKVRFHSIENIIRYVKDLIENLGLNYFSIRDDNFLANKKRVVEFSKEIIKRDWDINFNLQGSASFVDETTIKFLSRAGCDQIQIGIESLSPRILDFFNKKIDIKKLEDQIKLIRKYKIIPFGYFIAGLNECDEDIEPTINFIKSSGLMAGVLSPLVIYPGTELAKKANITDFFIKGKEIIFYSKKSFLKYKRRFDEAFKIAMSRTF